MLWSLQLTGSQADLVAAASSGNLQALNSMSTGNLTGLTANAGLSQSQVCILDIQSFAAHLICCHPCHSLYACLTTLHGDAARTCCAYWNQK